MNKLKLRVTKLIKENMSFLKEKINQALKKPKNRRKIWRSVGFYSLYGFLGLIVFTALAFAWFSQDLPTPNKIANRKPTQSTKIYDRTGQTLLYETGQQKRTIINSDQIAQSLKDATVAVEDTGFYTNHGFEAKAVLAAVAEKLTGKRGSIRGGSTITQQYVKNALLSSDRSLSRKIKELILAIELEFMFDKDQILTMYLNEIPYGNATAGAEAAARMYFGKPAKDLTLAESATLAAIPQAPTYYSPYGSHVDGLIARRNYVLDQMVKTGKISEEQAKEAKQEDTTTVGTAMKARRDSMLAPHFGMYIMEQLVDQYGEEKIQKEGLTVITTLDYDKQKAAEEAVANGVAKINKYGASNAALVAIDPKNGQILAMVGSIDYFNTSIDGNVNVADAVRQPGSSFKPIAYATAFKKPEYSPSKIIYDFTTDFGGTPAYVPHNYNNRTNGPVTMRAALANSLNIPAVKVMALAGIDNVLRTASDLGITTLTHRDQYGLSLVLGAGEVKPVEMAGAFGVFANNGVKNELTPVLKITDSRGKTLYDYDRQKKEGKQVLDPQVAYEIANILSDNDARALVFGTRTALAFSNRTVAAKTGTTSDFKDAWTVGFTPSIATAVWVGNNNSTAMKSGADGSVIAAPIFHTFIEKALASMPNEDFIKPDGIQELTVERYSNKLPGQYSTETTKDIFASWQIPTEKDDLHKIVKVCRGTDLLAPADLASELIEERVYTDLHSEMPNNPNWEDPVRAWASGNNLTSSVPTEYCDKNSITPAVSFVNPIKDATVSGNTILTVNVGNGVSRVEYFIDDVSIGGENSPFTKTFNFNSISEGLHKLSVVSSDDRGTNGRADIMISVEEGSGPAISNPVISQQGSSYNIVVTTDKQSSMTLVYNETGSSTTFTRTDSAPAISHTFLIPLEKGKSYLYHIRATDQKGNVSEKNGTLTAS
ncbi:MAG: penicillin-binding protein [Patescibacteria group bacterium]